MFLKIAKILLIAVLHLLAVEGRSSREVIEPAGLPENFIIGGGIPNIELQHVALIVSLQETPTAHGWLFTGTLITPMHVLTVAQTAHGFHRWRIGLGSINRLLMNFHDANDATIHPNYNPTNLHNNLAILHLVQQVPYTPVQLPPENPGPSPIYLYYGFGTTNPNNNDALPNILQQAQTIELPVPECQRYFGNQLVTNASWCCGATFNMGLCNGDQGGPLLHFHNHHLVGIASFWMTPCNSGFPNVFVRISHYVEWIRQVTGA